MCAANWRYLVTEYIRENAKPVDKFSHQPRLYALAARLAEGQPHDDDVLFAAAWMHDLGVFIGHRPEEPAALAAWDNTKYAMERSPDILTGFGFPAEKVPAVVEAIRTHQPSGEPAGVEGMLLRDADILEQLGAVAVLRTVSKVGRDTRFQRFSDALKVLQKNVEQLPSKLRLPSARREADARIKTLKGFLAAAAQETGAIEW